MQVYIKSFNRAYLLDRTLASLEQMLSFDMQKVTVLDDGTPELYLNKIQKKYPSIVIKKSPFYQEKSAALLESQPIVKKIPSQFWNACIAQGPEHFILLEDDMWFCQPWDLTLFLKEIEEQPMDMIKFFWLQNPRLIASQRLKVKQTFVVSGPKVLTENSRLFSFIFHSDHWSSKALKKLINYNYQLLPYYQKYIVAGGYFSKKFYNTCWQTTENSVNELLQIKEVLRSQVPFAVGHTPTEVLKATYKTTASGIAKDAFGQDLDVLALNKILNDAWLADQTYDINAFQEDLPTAWIEQCVAQSSDASVSFDVWQNWYAQFKASYEKIGCVL